MSLAGKLAAPRVEREEDGFNGLLLGKDSRVLVARGGKRSRTSCGDVVRRDRGRPMAPARRFPNWLNQIRRQCLWQALCRDPRTFTYGVARCLRLWGNLIRH